MLVDILVPMTTFATIFGILYVFLTTRNKERLAMIEKGADASIFTQRRTRNGIKLGLIAIGVAMGILMGQMLAHLSNMDEEPATLSMIFLWAGIGLVVEHYLAKKESKVNV